MYSSPFSSAARYWVGRQTIVRLSIMFTSNPVQFLLVFLLLVQLQLVPNHTGRDEILQDHQLIQPRTSLPVMIPRT